MTRISKNPDERRSEIMNISEKLFQSRGYENTSVNSIIDKIGIAKGTFYYYFKSKENLLKAIVDDLLEKIIQRAETVVKNKKLTAIKKFEMIYFGEKNDADRAEKLSKNLLHPKNRVLNEKINVQIVTELSPLIVEIVEQGKKEGVFKVENTLATVQFLIAGSQFIFDDGLFQWNREEIKNLRRAMQVSLETVLGAKRESLKFIVKKK